MGWGYAQHNSNVRVKGGNSIRVFQYPPFSLSDLLLYYLNFLCYTLINLDCHSLLFPI